MVVEDKRGHRGALVIGAHHSRGVVFLANNLPLAVILEDSPWHLDRGETAFVWSAPAAGLTGLSWRRSGEPVVQVEAGSNRTCPGTAATVTRAYDTADRPVTGANNQGAYSYDPLGRQVSVPAVDAPSPGNGDVTLAYDDSDSIQAIIQGDRTLSFTLDGAGRRYTQHTGVAGTNVTTLTNHYGDTGDNPVWSIDRRDGVDTTTRWAELIGGDLGLTITDGTSAELALADPHDSIASTITLPATGDPATGLDRWNSFDEYGNTTSHITGDPAGVTSQGYGWLGTKQRTTTATGLQLMGARLYNPVTGTFTSPDPVHKGYDTTYTYPNDPINKQDTTGQWSWRKALKVTYAVTAIAAGVICVLATVGACGVAALVAVGASAAWNGYRAYKREISVRQALTNVGTDLLLSRFRAVRAVKMKRLIPPFSRRVAGWQNARYKIKNRHVQWRAGTHRSALRRHPVRYYGRVGVNVYSGYSGYSTWKRK